MEKLVFFNTKGGTGKTTFCFNYGCYLATVKKKKVLMMDFDPQANLAFSFGKVPAKGTSCCLDNLILNYLKGEKKNFDDYLVSIKDGLFLLPCSNNISLIEEYLTNYIINKEQTKTDSGETIKNPAIERNNILLNILAESIKSDDFDYILIDSQPNFSLLSTTGIVFTGNIIVVMKAEPYSMIDIEYLKKIINNLNKKFSADIKITGVIINAYEGRKKVAVSTVKEIEDKYSNKIKIFNQKIKYLSQYQNSIALNKEAVFDVYPKSEASKNILSLFSEIDSEIIFSSQ